MNAKKIAAEEAVKNVRDGMVVGLGTGSTAYWAIQKLGEMIKQGLQIQAVASSVQSENLAREVGIPITTFAEIETINIAIDGADEVDAHLNLIKGGGGALLREKIIAYNSRQFFVVVDESKKVDVLGAFALPVEITQFAFEMTLRQIKSLGCTLELRKKEGKLFITDNGNYIADCRFAKIPEPHQLNNKLHSIPGVLETGSFVKEIVHTVVVGFNDGRVELFVQG